VVVALAGESEKIDVRLTEKGDHATRLVALLGHPVAHSLSPRMHNAAFRSCGLDLVYVAFDVARERLSTAIAGLRALGAAGANVTVPHKESVIPFLDDLDDVARKIGAVNTIVEHGGRLIGSNTDMYGFLMSLELTWGRSPQGAACLVLGAGGAARAVVCGLIQGGAGSVAVFNRTPERAEQLCQAAGAWGDTVCEPVVGERLLEAARQADLVVNATSAGLQDSVKGMERLVDIFCKRHMVIDLVYARQRTNFLVAAEKRGASTADGSEMLVQQAALSFELWTGVPAPVDVMRRELKRA
jgi:shikimate dehydrogenase